MKVDFNFMYRKKMVAGDRMNNRVVSIDEHQLLVSMKHDRWGAKSKIFKEWKKGDQLYFFTDGFLSAVAEMTSDTYFEKDSIWSEQYIYQIDIKFTYYISERNRNLSARDLFLIRFGDSTFGQLFMRQGIVKNKQIISEMNYYLSQNTNNLISIHSNLDNNLVKTFQKRLEKLLIDVRKLAQKSNYTKYSEIEDNINAILFLEIIFRRTEELKYLELGNLAFEYNELIKNSKTSDRIFEELLSEISSHLKMLGGIYAIFGKTWDDLNLPTSRIIDISKSISKIFNEIDYCVKNRFSKKNYWGLLNESYDYLLNQKSFDQYSIDEVDNMNFPVYFLNVLETVATEIKDKISIQDLGNEGEEIIAKTFGNKDFLKEIYVNDSSYMKVRNKVIRYLINSVDIRKLKINSYTENEQFNLLIFNAISFTPKEVQEYFDKNINHLEDQGFFLCVISNELNGNTFEKNLEELGSRLFEYFPTYFISKIQINTQKKEYYLIVAKKDKNQRRINHKIINIDDETSININQTLDALKSLKILSIEQKLSDKINIEDSVHFLTLKDEEYESIKSSTLNNYQKKSNILNHSIMNLLKDEQKLILDVALKKNINKIGIEDFYEVYRNHMYDSTEMHPITIHEFTQTVYLLNSLGIMVKSRKTITKHEYSYLINLTELSRWTLKKRMNIR